MRAREELAGETPDYAQALRLDGQGFIVFGVGPGLGAQSCHALAQAGAKLLCVDANADVAAETAKALGGEAIAADATKRADMERVFERSDAVLGASFSGIVDVIGVASGGPIADISDETWQWQFDIVVRHALYAMQLSKPRLERNGGGVMTFIGSISGEVAIDGQSAYGASKAALHHLVRMAAQEFGPAGIRVNAIAPGFIQTPRLRAKIAQEGWDDLAQQNWLRRTAVPADIARTVLFLSSDLSRYVNGNVLTLDGGISNGVPLKMPKL